MYHHDQLVIWYSFGVDAELSPDEINNMDIKNFENMFPVL
jgi:hypothetical protein